MMKYNGNKTSEEKMCDLTSMSVREDQIAVSTYGILCSYMIKTETSK
jgi:hypothetical protein